MGDSTGQDEDLKHLETKYGFSVEFMKNLTLSPNAAKLQIRSYKNNTSFICITALLLGMLLIGLAVLRHEAWVGLLSGLLGAVICTHFLKTLLSKNVAIKKVLQVARYHDLL